MPGASSPSGNRMLDRILRLQPALRSELESTNPPVMHEYCRTGEPIRHVYFPVNGIISLVVRFSGGEMIEVGTVGSEGFAGLQALLEMRRSPVLMMQQVPGEILFIPTSKLLQARDADPRIERLIRCYSAYTWRAAQQFSACNVTHRVAMRAARWILMTSDRVGRSEMLLTQEVLAHMLGVTRQAVNETARALQQEGLIRYSRGRMEITDRPRLEAAACECYRLIDGTYDDLFR